MSSSPESDSVSRRDFVRATSGFAASTIVTGLSGAASAAEAPAPGPKPSVKPVRASFPPLLTPAEDFQDVSRGNPRPFTLTGDALVEARLTPETWRLEIVADPFTSELVKEPASVTRQFTLANGAALDLPALMKPLEGQRYVCEREQRSRVASEDGGLHWPLAGKISGGSTGFASRPRAIRPFGLEAGRILAEPFGAWGEARDGG